MSSPSRMQRNSKDSRHGGVQFLWQLWRRDTLQMDKIRKLKLQSDKNAGLSIDATYIDCCAHQDGGDSEELKISIQN